MKTNTLLTVIAGVVGYYVLTSESRQRAEYAAYGAQLAAKGTPVPDYESWKRARARPVGSGPIL